MQRKVSITDNPNYLKIYRSASQNIHLNSNVKNRSSSRRKYSQPHNNEKLNLINEVMKEKNKEKMQSSAMLPFRSKLLTKWRSN